MKIVQVPATVWPGVAAGETERLDIVVEGGSDTEASIRARQWIRAEKAYRLVSVHTVTKHRDTEKHCHREGALPTCRYDWWDVALIVVRA